MAYGANENLDLTGAVSKKLEPEIYTGYITKVEVGEKPVYGTEDVVVSLNVTFKDEVTKMEHLEQYVEPKATSNTTLDKAEQYFYENLIHIGNSVVTPEELKEFKDKQVTSFKELITEFANFLSPKLGKAKQRVKIIGEIYNGKGFTKFPSFNSRTLDAEIMGEGKTFQPTPYITKIDSGVKLAFGKREKENNAKYLEAKKAGASSEEGGGAKKADDLFED